MPDDSLDAAYGVTVKIGLYKAGSEGTVEKSVFFVKGNALQVS